MADKWVDNEFYFGADRRRREGLGKRWGDRRQINDAAEPPPLGAVLRRLRVILVDVSTADDRQRAQRLANLAQAEAEKLSLLPCAGAIKAAARLILANDFAGADAHISEAMTLLSPDPRQSR